MISRHHAAAVSVLIGLLTTACSTGVPTPSSISTASPSTRPSTVSSSPPQAAATASLPGASWPPGAEAYVSCSISQQQSTQDATGSGPYQEVAKPTIEAAFAKFIEVEGSVVAYLPLSGWTKVEGTNGWGRFEHLVGGAARATVLFAASPEGDAKFTWAVAACDPAEYAPGTAVSGGVVVWKTTAGTLVPSATLLQRGVCGTSAFVSTLRLAGRGVFARDPSRFFGDRLLTSFAAGVRVPADAKQTQFASQGRKLWIARDGLAAYVGAPARVERWPRLAHDDDSVTDCN